MNTIFLYLGILLLAAFTIETLVMILYFLSFDRLLRLEYQKHYESWVRRGLPVGFLWRPKQSEAMSTLFRRPDLTARQWADDKPEWIWDDAEATDLYNSFRWWRLTYHIVTAAFVALIVVTVTLNFIIPTR